MPSYRDWQISDGEGWAGCLFWSNAWLVSVVDGSSSRAVRKLGWRSRQAGDAGSPNWGRVGLCQQRGGVACERYLKEDAVELGNGL